ncbi:protein kinase [Chloroflexi bacterium TSY]|nr:protein kinase [Chloroflexi bacterium TSY]
MTITAPFVLPDDVVLIPVDHLPTQVRERVEFEEGDYALTRPRARIPSKIIDAQAAKLLEEFRSPTTIVEAVMNYSLAHKTDPEDMLDEAFPILQYFINSQLLTPPGSEEAKKITPSAEVGDWLAGFQIVQCIQVLDDAELYRVQGRNDNDAALKILRPNSSQGVKHLLEREVAILTHLDNRINPSLLEEGTVEERSYLALEWCFGVPASMAADALRRSSSSDSREKLLKLCCTILEAYVCLHAQGVIHSDIHPRNILVADDGSVKLIDFGYSRLEHGVNEFSKSPRGGVGFYFEPEYARAYLSRRNPPQSSIAGEQYGLAALLYFLLTGLHYVDFSLEKYEMMRQIAEDSPLPFSNHEMEAWPEVEALLGKALSKNPADRFSSVAEFASNLRNVRVPVKPLENIVVPTAETEPTDIVRAKPVNHTASERFLKEVLQRVELSGPLFCTGLRTAPIGSVNYGAAGIAYALYRIACIRNDPALLSLADCWSMKAISTLTDSTAFYNNEFDITAETIGEVSLYHTASGVYCVQGLIGQAMGDIMSQQAAIEAFVAASKAPCENLDLTLGRSSTLLGCSFLLDAAPDTELVDTTSVRTLGNETMLEIWNEVDTFAPIRECFKLTYLGIAHGWAGLLYSTMRWCQASGHPLPFNIAERLQQLADCAEEAGRGLRWQWEIQPRSNKSASGFMPGWCNGSAGYIFLWTLAHHMLHENKYLTLAERAAWNTWEEPFALGSLCCGLAGRAYGLLNLYKHTGEDTWRQRAEQLTVQTAVEPESSTLGTNGIYRDSLYKGEIGMAILVADIATPEAASMPFFEAEGWGRP